ncbi:hypothetical protein [Streptomyces sp. NPDC101393]|uniref:hypothetical protein n=1 Tax=Streptomyces sp. NPDC101393 TaxID=3366141 RepID=UPI00381E0FC3
MASPVITHRTVQEVEAAMAAKQDADTADTKPVKRSSGGRTPGGGHVTKRTPSVLSGTVLTEAIDPDAERALKNEAVAADYNAAKARGKEYLKLEGRAADALRKVAEALMDLRAHFKEPGSRGRKIDWNGESVEYKALAQLLYSDLGLSGGDHDSTRRSVRYQIENVKRDRIPKKDWDHYGLSALTRGQRQALTAKFGKAHGDMEEAAKQTAEKASTGSVTGTQLVALAKRIDAGISVYSMASLRTLTPAQRKTFRDQLEDTRQKTAALLEELDGLD